MRSPSGERIRKPSGALGGTLCLTSDALRKAAALLRGRGRETKEDARNRYANTRRRNSPAGLVRGERSNSKGLLDQSKRPAAWASMV
jgi:hypothetical protein